MRESGLEGREVSSLVGGGPQGLRRGSGRCPSQFFALQPSGGAFVLGCCVLSQCLSHGTCGHQARLLSMLWHTSGQ